MRAPYRIVVVAIIAAALVGCDPYPVPSEPDHADLYVDFNTTGGASVMLMLGGDTTSTKLLDAGHAVAPALFDGEGQQTVRIQKQVDGGGSFVRISAANVYALGPHPAVNVDTGAALSLLSGMGYRSVSVDVTAPEHSDTAVWREPPDITEPGQWSWNAVVSAHAAPAGVITIVPPLATHAASRDFAQAGWIAGSVVGVAAAGFLVTLLAARWRRRRPAQPRS